MTGTHTIVMARFGALTVLALLLLFGCRPSQQSDAFTPTAPAETPTSPPLPISNQAAALAAARQRWDQSGVTNYRLVVAQGQPTVGCTYEVVDVADGQVVNAWRGSRFPLCVPRGDFTAFDACELSPADTGITVEDIFKRAESYQAVAESGAGSECGPTAQFELDEEFGIPMLSVSAGPANENCPTDNYSELAVIAFLPDYRPPAVAPDPYTACSTVGAGTVVQVGEAEGFIFNAAEMENVDLGWMMADDDVTGYWTPTEADIQAMDDALPAFLQEEEQREGSLLQQRAAEGMWQELSRYIRQFVGVIAGGEQLIWGNYFCRHGGEWQEQLVLVEDGGACYFSVTFNPATGEFSNLDINGES